MAKWLRIHRTTPPPELQVMPWSPSLWERRLSAYQCTLGCNTLLLVWFAGARLPMFSAYDTVSRARSGLKEEERSQF